METKTRKITLGTKEWADSNVNCYIGCSNNCRYCYAKKMAIRFNRKTEETWKIMESNQKYIDKGYRKRQGRVMFPTSHDITKESLDNCLTVLRKLLQSGNEILITTKPKFDCIEKICIEFQKFKDQIQFRFTITSLNNDLLNFWEPRAPKFEERFDSLKFSYNQGYKTSISIEPYLDNDPFGLVDILIPYVTESIWIGKMNYISIKNINLRDTISYDSIKEINSKENLLKILERAQDYDPSFLRIKDSIFNSISSNIQKNKY